MGGDIEFGPGTPPNPSTAGQGHIELTGTAGVPVGVGITASGHIGLSGELGLPVAPLRAAFMRAVSVLAASDSVATVTVPLPRPVMPGTPDFEVLAVLANAALDVGLTFTYTTGASSFTLTTSGRRRHSVDASEDSSVEHALEDVAGVTDSLEVEITKDGGSLVTPEQMSAMMQTLNFFVQLVQLVWKIVYGH